MSAEIDAMKIDILALNKLLNYQLNKLTEQRQSEVLVTHQSDRFRLKVERAASTKGVDGFVVDVSGDDLDIVQTQIRILYDYAKGLTNPAVSGNVIKNEGG